MIFFKTLFCRSRW